MDKSFKNLPPLEWIRAFEAAARCGSFTAAAEETGLTQPAISQRIGQLEKRLGTPLFHRKPRAISLTIQGEAWLPHVTLALSSLANSTEEMFGTGQERITLSASQSIIELWVLPRLRNLRAATKAQISIHTQVVGTYETPADEMVGIRYGSGDWPLPYETRLYTEAIAPVASPTLLSKGLHWSELPRIACAGPRPGWNDWSRAKGTSSTPVPGLRFDTYAAAQHAAEAGLGVFLGSLPLCGELLRTGRLMRAGQDTLRHHESYWLIAGRRAVSVPMWERLVSALC